jgi:Mrp family chromosome partitioning ATPase
MPAGANQPAHELVSFSLYRRLFPPPPEVLHGRSSAVEAIKRSIADNVVTVITALPGQGKTSLAWHTAVDLVLDGTYVDFDWTTHKYTQLDVRTGEKKETNAVRLHTPDPQKSTLYSDDVLVSMIYRFNWIEARAMSPLDRENKCAELLASRRYLVVLDNLETLPDIQHAVEYFSKLKGYGLCRLQQQDTHYLSS